MVAGWEGMLGVADTTLVAGLLVAAVALALAAGWLAVENRRMRRVHQRAWVAREQEWGRQAESAARERIAFEQHVETGKVGVAKMRREMEMLEAQLKIASHDLSTRKDMRDYHDLMMDKARLEIESLRLHIREQRKRMDEFGGERD